MSEIGNNGNDRVLLNAGNVSWLKYLLSIKGVLDQHGKLLGISEMRKRLGKLCEEFPNRPSQFQDVQTIIGWLHRTENGDPLTQVNSADRAIWEWFVGNLERNPNYDGRAGLVFKIELQRSDKTKLVALMSQKKISSDDLIRREDYDSCQKLGSERAKLTMVLTSGNKFIDAGLLGKILRRLLEAENEPGITKSLAEDWARGILDSIRNADLYSANRPTPPVAKTAKKPSVGTPVVREFEKNASTVSAKTKDDQVEAKKIALQIKRSLDQLAERTGKSLFGSLPKSVDQTVLQEILGSLRKGVPISVSVEQLECIARDISNTLAVLPERSAVSVLVEEPVVSTNEHSQTSAQNVKDFAPVTILPLEHSSVEDQKAKIKKLAQIDLLLGKLVKRTQKTRFDTISNIFRYRRLPDGLNEGTLATALRIAKQGQGEIELSSEALDFVLDKFEGALNPKPDDLKSGRHGSHLSL